MKTEKKHNKMNNNKIIIIVNTRPKASGSSSRFQGGGQGTRHGTRFAQDTDFRGMKKFSGGGWWCGK